MRARFLRRVKSNAGFNDSLVIQAQKLWRSSAITTTMTINAAGMTIGGTNHLAITGPPEKCTSASASFEHDFYVG
jgi:hypothetical protein